jgi:hypothetical protein
LNKNELQEFLWTSWVWGRNTSITCVCHTYEIIALPPIPVSCYFSESFKPLKPWAWDISSCLSSLSVQLSSSLIQPWKDTGLLQLSNRQF